VGELQQTVGELQRKVGELHTLVGELLKRRVSVGELQKTDQLPRLFAL
jgi:hypothetical protein